MKKDIYKSIMIIFSFFGAVVCMIILGNIFGGCKLEHKVDCSKDPCTQYEVQF